MNKYATYISNYARCEIIAIGKNNKLSDRDLGRITGWQRVIDICAISPVLLDPEYLYDRMAWAIHIIETNSPSDFEKGIRQSMCEAIGKATDEYRRTKHR